MGNGCAKGKDCTFCHDVSHEKDTQVVPHAKSTMMRLGLVTPKFSKEMGTTERFCMEDDNEEQFLSGSEQGSTTCAGSEQESFEMSDHEEANPQTDQAIPFHPQYAPPGLVAPPGTPSLGGMKHGNGGCKPCAWFWKPQGCQNGSECLHCHLCPMDELKNRKRSKAAMFRLGLATPKARPASHQTATFTLSLSNCL